MSNLQLLSTLTAIPDVITVAMSIQEGHLVGEWHLGMVHTCSIVAKLFHHMLNVDIRTSKLHAES